MQIAFAPDHTFFHKFAFSRIFSTHGKLQRTKINSFVNCGERECNIFVHFDLWKINTGLWMGQLEWREGKGGGMCNMEGRVMKPR